MQRTLQGASDKARRASHRQAIGRGAVMQTNIFHSNAIVQAGEHAKQDARRLRRLDKHTLHGIAKSEFQPKGHPARPAAHATGQIDKQRMRGIDDNALRG